MKTTTQTAQATRINERRRRHRINEAIRDLLARDEPLDGIAERFGLTRDAIYKRIERWHLRDTRSVAPVAPARRYRPNACDAVLRDDAGLTMARCSGSARHKRRHTWESVYKYDNGAIPVIPIRRSL